MVRKRRPAIKAVNALAIAACLTAVSGVALAEPRGNAVPAMPIGPRTPAPDGFIDLCQRNPAECPALGPAPNLERLAVEANQRRWSRLFGLAAPPPSAAAPITADAVILSGAPITALVPRLLAYDTTSAGPAPSLRAEEALAADDSAVPALEAAAEPLGLDAPAAVDFASVAVAGEAPPAAIGAPVEPFLVGLVLDREGWRMINRINRRLNREIRHVEDRDLHGQDDRWSLPVQARGDCEDFVLAKRAALIDAGVAAEALSIAIAETPRGEVHAVLLVATDRGEFVLDSLSPWVSRWDRVNYRWRERQVQGGSFDWVSVAL
jgi:predicted transglutaminase-like cysteine proteinase